MNHTPLEDATSPERTDASFAILPTEQQEQLP